MGWEVGGGEEVVGGVGWWWWGNREVAGLQDLQGGARGGKLEGGERERERSARSGEGGKLYDFALKNLSSRIQLFFLVILSLDCWGQDLVQAVRVRAALSAQRSGKKNLHFFFFFFFLRVCVCANLDRKPGPQTWTANLDPSPLPCRPTLLGRVSCADPHCYRGQLGLTCG